jgi:hypothetical protein
MLRSELDGTEYMISGRVFEEGRPVGGATVYCDGRETKTLFDGSYKFEGLSSGTHVITVVLEGYKTQKQIVELVREKDVKLDFHLESKRGDGKIYGYIFDEFNKEPVKTGGSVYVYRPTLNRYTSVDPISGYYEFTDLPPGLYKLWISALGYEDEMKIVAIQEGEEKRVDFIIKKRSEEIPWG